MKKLILFVLAVVTSCVLWGATSFPAYRTSYMTGAVNYSGLFDKELTVIAWIKDFTPYARTNAAVYGCPVAYCNGADNNDDPTFYMRVDATSEMAGAGGFFAGFIGSQTGGDYAYSGTTAPLLVTGNNMIAMTADLTKARYNKIEYFFQGQPVARLQGQENVDQVVAFDLTRTTLLVGRHSYISDTVSSPLEATMELLLIYNRKLSNNEIADIYSTNGAKYSKKGLVDGFDFRGVSGQYIASTKSFGFAKTILNTVGAVTGNTTFLRTKARSY